MPRTIASSASVAWVQCVMGRPASLGFSQASAMIAQICSGENVAGVPGRGASASRSRNGRPAAAVQRARQRCTVARKRPLLVRLGRLTVKSGFTAFAAKVHPPCA